jgi:hypothetical protein
MFSHACPRLPLAAAILTLAASTPFFAPAAASAAVTPTPGSYTGALTHNANVTIHFAYSTLDSPHIRSFSIGEVEGRSTLFTRYFDHTFVRNAEFWWEGRNQIREFVQVTGHWTAPHTVEGTIQVNHGAVKDFHAHLIVGGGGGLA